MALAWIEEIHNNSSYDLLIRQTDPSKNPYIDSVEGGGWHDKLSGDFHSDPGKPTYHDWFMVKADTRLKTSGFVIPWANTNGWVQIIVNRDKKDPLIIDVKKSGLRFQVAPEGGGKQDFVRFYDWNLKAVSGASGPAQIGVGTAGGANNTSGRLVVTDDYLDYQITASNSAGDDTLSAFGVIGATLLAVAGVAATAAAA